MLQKLPSPCRAELLRVSSPTNSFSARRANGADNRSNTECPQAFNVRVCAHVLLVVHGGCNGSAHAHWQI